MAGAGYSGIKRAKEGQTLEQALVGGAADATGFTDIWMAAKKEDFATGREVELSDADRALIAGMAVPGVVSALIGVPRVVPRTKVFRGTKKAACGARDVTARAWAKTKTLAKGAGEAALDKLPRLTRNEGESAEAFVKRVLEEATKAIEKKVDDYLKQLTKDIPEAVPAFPGGGKLDDLVDDTIGARNFFVKGKPSSGSKGKCVAPSGLGRIHPNLQPNGALRSTAKEVHSLAHPIKLKNQTVAIAEVRMPDGTRKIVASANTSAGLPANQQAALRELGVEIAPMRTTNGVKNHAEINIIQSLPEGASVERWGISSGRHQVPDPCSECIGPVQQIGGNLEGK